MDQGSPETADICSADATGDCPNDATADSPTDATESSSTDESPTNAAGDSSTDAIEESQTNAIEESQTDATEESPKLDGRTETCHKPNKWLAAATKLQERLLKESSDNNQSENGRLSSPRSIGRLVRTGSEFLEDINNGKYDQWTPELCVQLLRLPNVQNYAGMKKWLENSKKQQLSEFLELDGLGILFEALEKLGDKGFGSVADALLQLECVLCVRVVMNSKAGLDYITDHKECCRKLVKALDTKNIMMKKQVFELLSALTIYKPNSYEVAMDALENYKVYKNLRYKFSVIMNELKASDLVTYTSTILGFVNCLIISGDDLKARIRVRNEFIGLGLLDFFDSHRHEDDMDFYIQLEAFNNHKHSDDELAESMGLTSSKDVASLFQEIYERVRDTPQEFILFSILQNLSRIDPKTSEKDHVWDILEGVSEMACEKHSAERQLTLKHNLSVTKTDVSTQTIRLPRVLKTTVVDSNVSDGKTRSKTETNKRNNLRYQSNKTSFQQFKSIEASSSSNSESGSSSKEEDESGSATPPELGRDLGLVSLSELQTDVSAPSPRKSGPKVPPPPPPPLPISTTVPPPMTKESKPMPPPPPPPPPMPLTSNSRLPPPPPPPPPPCSNARLPPPPPLPPMTFVTDSPSAMRVKGDMGNPSEAGSSSRTSLHPSNVRKPARTPSQRMRLFNWTKIPPQAIGESVWRSMTLKSPNIVGLDYESVEELFSRQETVAGTPLPSSEKPKRESKEIALLDSRKSLSVNIFLKQFKDPQATIIENIQTGNSNYFGVEKLGGFLKIMPEREEVDVLKNYSGDKANLGLAETFYLKLMDVPQYELRLHCMLLKEDFPTHVKLLESQIELVERVANNLLNDESLEKFLALILDMGNFLNSGSYAGNAAGFKLSSLLKLCDTRSNKPRMTLLHYLVETVETKDKKILSFTSYQNDLRQASKITLDSVKGEVAQLESRVNGLTTKLQQSQQDVQVQYEPFIKDVADELHRIEQHLSDVQILANKVRNHFCEEEKVQLEECYAIFANLYDQIQKAKQDNEQRKKLEEKAKKMKEEREKLKTKRISSSLKDYQDNEEECLIDLLLGEIKKGSFKLRKVGRN